MFRQRRPAAAQPTFLSTPAPAPRVNTGKGHRRTFCGAMDPESQSDERRPLLSRDAAANAHEDSIDSPDSKMAWMTQNRWIVLAIASGACAAFNGVFAKL